MDPTITHTYNIYIHIYTSLELRWVEFSIGDTLKIHSTIKNLKNFRLVSRKITDPTVIYAYII